MKVSLKWLQEWVEIQDYLDRPEGAQQMADLLTSRGLEVESVHRQNQGLEHVISVQIIQKQKHPEADRLSLCTVNPGNNAYLEIVCGAQNMKVGDVVCLAQIGAHLPNGLKIEKSKIRGVVSNGMLCSESELGLKSTSDGILILPEKTPVGWKVADILALDDVILEIKLTANRGDCLSHRGMAREIAAALGRPLKTPKVPELSFASHSGGNKPIRVELAAGADAPQFFGCSIEGVVVGPSPGWLKTRLEAIGQRSINNIVDASNFLMFEYGFPVHIYDADKIEGGLIQVRKSKAGEKLKLLDDSEIVTTGEELIISDGVKPVGLAGVMGGANSEVSATTKRVFLECAEFNPTLVRRAAFRYQKRSEASLRFEKGIDRGGLKDAIQRLADLVVRLSSGVVVGATQGTRLDGGGGGELSQNQTTSIQTSPEWINAFLGTAFEQRRMLQLLEGLDCKVEGVGGDIQKPMWRITPPSYRLDLKIPQDIAEEIARCFGYDQIPSTIPALSGSPKARHGSAVSHRLETLDGIKNCLADQGLSEVLNYAFQSESWIQKFGFQSSVKILNPLSEEQGFMVPSLLPGLMKAYQENERHHFGSEPLAVRIFEVRPVFEGSKIEATSETETGVTETWKLAVLISGPRFDQAIKSERGEVDFFDLKNVVESVFERLGTKGIRYRATVGQASIQSTVFHPGQTLQVAVGKDPVGFLGRIHPKLEAELKLRHPVYWAEINVEPVIALTPSQNRQFKAWSGFPTMERDFALLVKEDVSAENLIQVALKFGKPIAKVVKIFDTYKGAHIPEGMISIGIRVIFSDEAKSLEEKQVDQCAEVIVKKWSEEFGASLR